MPFVSYSGAANQFGGILGTEVTIRYFTLADVRRIVELENASFTVDAFEEATFISYYQNCSDLFVVAEIAGEIEGYMLTCPTTPESSLVISIAIDPSYRRKRVGRTLAEFTFNRLKASGIKNIALRVRTTNVIGRNFWESLGFVVAGVIPKFYCDGGDALEMKRLGEP